MYWVPLIEPLRRSLQQFRALLAKVSMDNSRRRLSRCGEFHLFPIVLVLVYFLSFQIMLLFVLFTFIFMVVMLDYYHQIF